MAKHGNRSNSGKCGSADFVEALGTFIIASYYHRSITNLIIGANIAADCSVAQDALNKTGFSFLFSQKFHPTMKSVAQIRRELGVRTIFNILGPLVNPARPAYIVAGNIRQFAVLCCASILNINTLRRFAKFSIVEIGVLSRDPILMMSLIK